MFNLDLAYNALDFKWWQLLTAHFIHYDSKHLLLNLLAIPLLIYLFKPKPKQLLCGFLVALVLIDGYLLFSSVHVYAGFSGILYVIPGNAMGNYFGKKQWFNFSLLLFMFLLYILFTSNQQNISNGIIWNSLQQAHTLGLFAGIVTTKIKVRNRQSRRNSRVFKHN